jgi:hypothetical protein
MTLGWFFSAGVVMNGRILRSALAERFTLLQKFPRCERAQHTINRSGVGSFDTFAAQIANGWFRMDRPSLRRA